MRALTAAEVNQVAGGRDTWVFTGHPISVANIEAIQASFVEAIEDTRKVRRRATQVLLEQMDASAELVPEAETVTLTKKTKDGTSVRKATPTKRDRPDARWVAEFLRDHTELLALVVNLPPKSDAMCWQEAVTPLMPPWPPLLHSQSLGPPPAILAGAAFSFTTRLTGK